MVRSLVQFCFFLVVAAAALLYHPFLPNTNLIKELLWWPALLAGLGVFLLCAPARERLRTANWARAALFAWKWPLAFGGAFLLWTFLNSGKSPDPHEAFLEKGRLVGWLLGGTAMALVFHRGRYRAWMLLGIRSAVLVSALYMLCQTLGYDFFQWKQPGRPPGTFTNPNFSALFLAAFLPWMVVEEGGIQRWLGLSRKGGNPLKGLPLGSLLLGAAILFSQSRAGLLALLTGLAFLTLGIWRSSQQGRANPLCLKKIRLIVLIALLFLELALAFLLWRFPEKTNHLFSRATGDLRVQMWKGCFQFWAEKPWTGWGSGSFRFVAESMTPLLEGISGNRKAAHAHSWLIEALVEQGIVGAGLLVTALLLWGIGVWKKIVPHGLSPLRLRALALLAGTVGLLTGGAVGVWLNWWGGGWLLTLLMGWTLAFLPEKMPPKPVRRLWFWQLSGAILLLAALPAAWLSTQMFRAERSRFAVEAAIERRAREKGPSILNRTAAIHYAPPVFHFRKAQLYFMLDSLPDARSCLLQREARGGVYGDVLVFKAFLQRKMGLEGAALETMKGAFAQSPSGENARTLARFYLDAGKDQAAFDTMENYLTRSLYPPLLEFYVKQMARQGRTEQARDFVARLRQNPQGPFTEEQWGKLARWEAELSLNLGEAKRAAFVYPFALLFNREDTKSWNDYGRALKQLGRLEGADQAYKKGLELSPKNYGLLFNRLELALERGDPLLAAQLVDRLKPLKLPKQARTRLNYIDERLLQRR